jgi:hypothetical protein
MVDCPRVRVVLYLETGRRSDTRDRMGNGRRDFYGWIELANARGRAGTAAPRGTRHDRLTARPAGRELGPAGLGSFAGNTRGPPGVRV